MPIAGPPLAKSLILTDVLAKGLATKPDDLALVSNESRWTWRELDATSRRLAANYLALGLRPGDRVASLLPNRGALFVHYLACHRAGLAATPLNYRYQAPEIDHALEVSGARILVTLIHEMIRRGSKRGVAALCLGGGNAVALAVEL